MSARYISTAVVLLGLASTAIACSQNAPPQPTAPSAITSSSAVADHPAAAYLTELREQRSHLMEVSDTELLSWGHAACAEARVDETGFMDLIEMGAGIAASEAGAPTKEREAIVSAAFSTLCPDAVPDDSQ